MHWRGIRTPTRSSQSSVINNNSPKQRPTQNNPTLSAAIGIRRLDSQNSVVGVVVGITLASLLLLHSLLLLSSLSLGLATIMTTTTTTLMMMIQPAMAWRAGLVTTTMRTMRTTTITPNRGAFYALYPDSNRRWSGVAAAAASSSTTSCTSKSTTTTITTTNATTGNDNSISSNNNNNNNICPTLWDVMLPVGGRCVALQLFPGADDVNDQNNDDDDNQIHLAKTTNRTSATAAALESYLPGRLHPDEIAYGLALPAEKTRHSFYMGRLALRRALHLDKDDCTRTGPILKDAHGRPQIPAGYVASISHKGSTGVALVAPAGVAASSASTSGTNTKQLQCTVGVDLEYAQSPSSVSVSKNNTHYSRLATKILTRREQETLGQLPNVTADEEVMLRFSLKECLYKALHPWLCQYIGFQQAEVTPAANGTATLQLLLPSSPQQQQFASVTAYWQRMGPYFLTTSRVCVECGTSNDLITTTTTTTTTSVS